MTHHVCWCWAEEKDQTETWDRQRIKQHRLMHKHERMATNSAQRKPSAWARAQKGVMLVILFVLDHFYLSVASLSSIMVQPVLLNMTYRHTIKTQLSLRCNFNRCIKKRILTLNINVTKHLNIITDWHKAWISQDSHIFTKQFSSIQQNEA